MMYQIMISYLSFILGFINFFFTEDKEMYNYRGARLFFFFLIWTGVCVYLLCSPVTCTHLLVNCHQQKGSYVPLCSCKSGPVVLDVGLVG